MHSKRERGNGRMKRGYASGYKFATSKCDITWN